MEYRFLYIPCKDKDEARHIGAELVKTRLAACANIIPGMESIYHWNGKIEHDQESILILKSTANQISAIETTVQQLHSYDVPCVISLPIQSGNEPYLKWIKENVGG